MLAFQRTESEPKGSMWFNRIFLAHWSLSRWSSLKLLSREKQEKKRGKHKCLFCSFSLLLLLLSSSSFLSFCKVTHTLLVAGLRLQPRTWSPSKVFKSWLCLVDYNLIHVNKLLFLGFSFLNSARRVILHLLHLFWSISLWKSKSSPLNCVHLHLFMILSKTEMKDCHKNRIKSNKISRETSI